MTTGGGTMNASNLTIHTSGRSSAAIRSDRGGETVTVNGGNYTTDGVGSPAIDSTADITVNDAAFTTTASEGVVVEGKNSVTLNNVVMNADNNQHNSDKSEYYHAVMIYQSMSGDADSGTSSFNMTDGSLISMNGHVFHVTNTNAVINLTNVEITNKDASNVLISVCDDGWSGAKNIATLNANNQDLEGAVLVGSNSTLTLNLSDGSSLSGYVSGSITNASGADVSTSGGTVSVTIDETSTWSLTADSYITSFNGDASRITDNGYTLYVNGIPLAGTV